MYKASKNINLYTDKKGSYTLFFVQPATIILSVSLLLFFVSCRKETDQKIFVDFSYNVLNNSYSIPVAIEFINKSGGAQYYKWQFEGGNPATYNQREPGTILFTKAGNIEVRLEAWNDDEHLSKTIVIQIDSVVKANFEANAVLNFIAPAEVVVQNFSAGSTQFKWRFPGGQPDSSDERFPVTIKYNVPGAYMISLLARNGRGIQDTISRKIIVRPPLSADFLIEPSFEDDDNEAPLKALLHNTSVSATNHLWSAPGGLLTSATDSIPSVTYSTPGTYTITYKADNGKQTQTISKTIVVKPNSFLRSFYDIQLGINSASNSIGSYFSTILRKSFTQAEVTPLNGSKIDIVYFGLNQTFSYNRFISPDSVMNWTFSPIPGATYTSFINRQETCACNANISVADFDGLNNGNTLNAVNVLETPGGMSAFDHTSIFRIILFKNAQGKKGLIKIKQFVNAGLASYITCDIKIQKD